MKTIIQRSLPLNVKYHIIDKQYIPLENSFGCFCDNCHKLIANIATIRNDNNETFKIGFDCLETLLLNNSLLNKHDIESYEKTKKMLPKILRFSKELKALIKINNGLDGFLFERPSNLFSDSGWVTYYLLKGNTKYNTNVKLKEVDFDFLIKTLKHIFINHKIEII